MAQHITAQGTAQEVHPANGQEFTLDEIKKYIGGGYLEGITLTPHAHMYLDEQGALKPDRQENIIARAILYKYREDHRLSGNTIYGDVLIASTRETGDE